MEILSNLQTQTQQLDHDIREKTKEQEILRAKVKRLEKESEEVLAAIPIGVQQEGLIRDLRDISRRTGYTFTSLSFARGRHATVDAHSLNATFSVVGDRKMFGTFLKTLEENPRFIGFDSLSYGIGRDDLGNEQIGVSLSLYSFFVPAP